MYWFYAHGKKTTIRTRFSQGMKKYEGDLLRFVRQQIYLTPDEFDRFMDCPMQGADYLNLMIHRGHVKVQPQGPTKGKPKKGK